MHYALLSLSFFPVSVGVDVGRSERVDGFGELPCANNVIFVLIFARCCCFSSNILLRDEIIMEL
jgi:hypothetical protein